MLFQFPPKSHFWGLADRNRSVKIEKVKELQFKVDDCSTKIQEELCNDFQLVF